MGGSAGYGAADTAVSGAWASLVGLVLKLLAALGIYRAGGKAEKGKQDADTLNRIETFNEAARENDALDADALRQRLRDRGAVRD